MLLGVTYTLLVFGKQKVVQGLQQVIAEYEDLMRKRNLVPRFSYDRGQIRTRYDVDRRPDNTDGFRRRCRKSVSRVRPNLNISRSSLT